MRFSPKRLFRTGSVVALLLGITTALPSAELPDHVPGRLVVGVRRDANPEATDRALAAHQARVRRKFESLSMSVLDVPENGSDAIIESLKRTGLFEYVERDYYAHTAATDPNDPSYASQWHLPAIQAPDAWSLTTGAASVVVAVVDTGVDPTHPDLAAKLVPGWNFVTGTSNTSDVLGHGTAVAGTIAAASNNGIGGAGVSWNSMIMPLVVVDANDYATYSNIAAAIQYAADHNVRVINVSIGGTSASSVLQNAVDYAWGKGAVIFSSAMNASAITPYYPAACNNVIAVSATDSTDSLASFSDFGNWIILSAPGVNILTTTMGGGYGYWNGTSFSSPIAAGVAALALAANPSLTNSALIDIMEQNADDIGLPGRDPSFGWGRVNAYKTVTAAKGSAPSVTVSLTPSSVTLNAAQSQQFTATVAGATNTTLTWSATAGAITSTGLYTAPTTLTADQNVVVTATAASGNSGTAALTLVAARVSIAPLTASLTASQTQQFSATVTGASSATVTWSLNPAVGTIGSNGLYTAPSSISSTQTVTLTAMGSGGVVGSSTITLSPTSNITTSGFTAIRVNAAGSSVTDSLGQSWSADTGFTGGITFRTGTSISNTQSPAIYQTCRYGPSFSYAYTVPNGSYTVNLKFAEIGVTAAGKRLFNASLNGSAILTNFDIFAQAGGANIALDKAFPVTVTNGQILIQFSSGSSDYAAVNGIEIVAGSTFTPVRVNTGGASMVDTAAQTWAADANFTGGNVWRVSNTIAGTNNQALYQTCRYGPSFSYQYTVPNGSYKVTLKFAEIGVNGAGKRVFNASLNGLSILANFDIYAQAGGAYIALDKSFPVTVTNGQINLQFTAGSSDSPAVNGIEIVVDSGVSNTGTFTPVRTNGGGASLVDNLGQTWSADANFSAGYTWSVTQTIAGTATPALYQTCRYGSSFSYQYTVPNGTYNVNLKFAELTRTAAGQRVFNVSVNGSPVLTNFDIFAQAGALTALDKSFSVTVTNGQITVLFSSGSSDWPLVNALEIVQSMTTTASSTTTATARVNSGGWGAIDDSGNSWSTDSGFTDGFVWAVTRNIANASSQSLYRTCRFGPSFKYDFPVANGRYTVNLKFAELTKTAIGQRIFNVTVNGTRVLTNFDIIASAGGAFIAVDKSFQVTANNGSIDIAFSSGSVDWPAVNGIEIIRNGTSATSSTGATELSAAANPESLRRR